MLSDVAPYAALAVVLVVFLLVDLRFFARGREPGFREGVWWSLGWLAVSLAAALVVWALDDGEAAFSYTTVYLITRSLSVDNLLVFVLLFAYFGVPGPLRARLLFWGIVLALILRGAAIGGGIALIEQFHFVLYVLGATLLVLAYRVFRGVEENVDPDRNLMVRLVRKGFPVTGEYHDHHWFRRVDGRAHATPLFLCLAAVVFADLAFAIDSTPAAFAITRDPFLIWMGNGFAVLGMRALFVLVEGAMRRFRYLDQTIAVVLALVALKLLLDDVVEISAEASLAGVIAAFAIGIGLSLWKDLGEVEDETEHGVQRK